VSGVKDFSYAFSKHRKLDGTYALDGNLKATKFVGTDISKWITTSVTSLFSTFRSAADMNADLSAWTVSKVTTLEHTFNGASKFAGNGLISWNTASVTTLAFTFGMASEMNTDLSGWTVGKVTTLESTFNAASKFTGTGLDLWDTSSVTTLESTFYKATSLASCSKRKIVDVWRSSHVFVDTTYVTKWASETCSPLTDATFKEATWDWVQNLPTDATAAMTKWGDIARWDVSGVKDFSHAFSKHRNEDGTYALDGNLKATTFVGTDISKWITTSVTSLFSTFRSAADMNADFSAWTVGSVQTMQGTFDGAVSFVGEGVSMWKAGLLVDMSNMFRGATAFNSNLAFFNVEKVTNMEGVFKNTRAFKGDGLEGWNVAKVTRLNSMFDNSINLDVDLHGWDVSSVQTFEFESTFRSANSLSACRKRKIVDAWSKIFMSATVLESAGTWGTWTNEKCACDPGWAYSDSMTSCSQCTAGKYSDGEVACTDCGVDNEYAQHGSTECKTCGAGFHTSGGTETTRIKCDNCPAGVACSGHSAQTPCGGGTYAPASSKECHLCRNPNEFSYSGSEKCSLCAKGSFTGDDNGKWERPVDTNDGRSTWIRMKRTTCTRCPAKFVCPGDGNTNRKACAPGTFAPKGSSTECTDIKECSMGT
jgi:surface protein